MHNEMIKPGSLIDGFSIGNLVHFGGMSAIWSVTRDDVSIPAVMKIPRLTEGDNPASIICFEVELMILPEVTGIHVPRFISSGDFTAQPYIVMEHIPGESLENRLGKGVLPPDETAGIGSKIAVALHEIHRQHIIHFDLTPDNVLFRENGDAVLIDLGLSRHEQLPDLMAEIYHLPMGTAPYISPEQVLGMRNDHRSDIFSLGVILYELITGELPFGSPVSITGFKRRLYQLPDPPKAINKNCPDWLQEIILRCLEADPMKRHGSAAQLAFDLKNPDTVPLTSRADRTGRNTFWTSAGRWMNYFRTGAPTALSLERHLDTVPIIMAAVDTHHGVKEMKSALIKAVQRVFDSERGARLTCITVRKTLRVGIDTGIDNEGHNLHLQRLIELKQWAAGLNIPPGKISFHVLESPDPAEAIIDFARSNHVDHIVIGAPGYSTVFSFHGKVCSRVVAEAPCTVTAVKVHHSINNILENKWTK